MTPWWVTLFIGIGTAAVTIAGVVITSSRQQKDIRQQIEANTNTAQATQRGQDRAEWFRRVQWAHSLLGSSATEEAGLDVLRVLAADADDADVRLIRALVKTSPSIEVSLELPRAPGGGSADDGDGLVYGVQDGDTEALAPRERPMTEPGVTPRPRVVRVNRTQVHAAQLLVDLDTRLGEPTPDVIKKIAAAT